MKKRLIVDILPLIGERSGVGRYTYEIVLRLSDEYFEKSYFAGFITKDLNIINGVKVNFLRILKRYLPFRSLLKRLFNKRRVDEIFDLYWQPNFIPLESIKAKRVVTTVHDFSWEIYSDFHPRDRIDYFKKYFYKNIERSDLIITVSNFVKNEILDRLPHFEKRIEVIYNGYDSNLFKPSITKKRYILYVGNIEPRKNLINVLKAYSALPDRIKKEYNLILAGGSGWKNVEIFKLIEKDKNHIIYTGYLKDQELARLYAEATLLLYPSIYEGFGLPVIEAMGSGTAVITSKNSAMEEISGNAAVYVNPRDIEEMKYWIETLLEDENRRKYYEIQGLEVARNFSWERSAQKHQTIFRST